MKNIETNSSEKDSKRRIYEGPAQLLNEIPEGDFEYARGGIVSGNQVTTNVYGQEGVGWEKVRPAPAKTAEERLKQEEDRRFGREMIKIVATPDGTHYHRENFPNEE